MVSYGRGERKQSMHSLARALARYVRYLLGLGELLLGLHVLLRFLGANPETPVVDFLYRMTRVVLSPFRGMFSDVVPWDGAVVDLTALSAMVGYAIAGFLIAAFVEFVARERA
ncbi:MAG: YggT family protein [Candidatus Jorgensenbacteria bacterium]